MNFTPKIFNTVRLKIKIMISLNNSGQIKYTVKSLIKLLAILSIHKIYIQVATKFEILRYSKRKIKKIHQNRCSADNFYKIILLKVGLLLIFLLRCPHFLKKLKYLSTLINISFYTKQYQTL